MWAYILHESEHSLLLSFGGRSRWFAREAVRIDESGQAWLPDDVAKRDALDEIIPVDDLDELVSRLTIPSDIAITPKPNRDHQQDAFAKLRQLRCFALHMQMRGGKTKVAIDILCNHHANGVIDHVLWCCPLSIVATAQEQWRKWRTTDLPVTIVALETLSQCRAERFAQMTAVMDERCALIIDESHMVKSGLTKRSKRLYPLTKRAAIRGVLTGTPVVNNIGDIYNQMRLLDWRILGYRSYYAFRDAHLVMSSKIPGLIRGSKNLEHLQARMAPFVVEWRRDYSEQQDYNVEWLTMTETQQIWYREIKDAVLERMAAMTDARHDIYLLFTALASVMSGKLSVRILQAVFGRPCPAVVLETPKHQAALDWIAQQDGPALVWCARRHDLAELADSLPDAITVHGGIPPNERHQRIQTFRAQGGVLLAMTQVARRGIEIAECSNVLYYSNSFDYEMRAQSEMRTVLPDSKGVCTYTDLVFADSLDERMRDALVAKENIAERFARLFREDKDQALKELKTL